MSLFKRGVKVSVERLPRGHALLVRADGSVVDLGVCTDEDVKLLAYVAQEAYVRLSGRKTRLDNTTLGRVRELTRRFYRASKDVSS